MHRLTSKKKENLDLPFYEAFDQAYLNQIATLNKIRTDKIRFDGIGLDWTRLDEIMNRCLER